MTRCRFIPTSSETPRPNKLAARWLADRIAPFISRLISATGVPSKIARNVRSLSRKASSMRRSVPLSRAKIAIRVGADGTSAGRRTACMCTGTGSPSVPIQVLLPRHSESRCSAGSARAWNAFQASPAINSGKPMCPPTPVPKSRTTAALTPRASPASSTTSM